MQRDEVSCQFWRLDWHDSTWSPTLVAAQKRVSASWQKRRNSFSKCFPISAPHSMRMSCRWISSWEEALARVSDAVDEEWPQRSGKRSARGWGSIGRHEESRPRRNDAVGENDETSCDGGDRDPCAWAHYVRRVCGHPLVAISNAGA